jgi:23S rRNA pseudouridine2605 synthase
VLVSITEGKIREVRKLLEHVGLKVNRLIRLSYGPFELGDLEPGGVEEMAPKIVREQLGGLIAPENLPQGQGRGRFFRPERPVRNSARTKAEPGANAPSKPRSSAKAETPAKPAYKAGWARPKAKPRPAASARPQRRSGAKPKGRK